MVSLQCAAICHKRLFNPPSQFSRLGIQVSPLYIFIYSCLYGMVGTEGWVGMDCLSFLFFSFLIPFYYWCAIHVYFHVYSHSEEGNHRSWKLILHGWHAYTPPISALQFQHWGLKQHILPYLPNRWLYQLPLQVAACACT